MLHLCGSKLPNDYTRKRQSQSSIIDPGKYLYVKAKYIIVYNTSAENVPIEKIREQHIVLNRDFNADNPDIVRVPSSGHYNFASVIGDSKIRFLPLDANEITENSEYVVRVKTNQTIFSGISQVKSFASLQFTEGSLNIFIANLTNGLLGQAPLFSSCALVSYKTVGSQELPGDTLLVNYNHGRATTHEVAHTFGIPHTFSQNGSCDSSEISKEFDDIPKQKNPNYEAVIVQDNGVYSGSLDNHFRDCNTPVYNISGKSPPYSCSSDCGSNYEMFFNFMDYGNDSTAIMFTKTQVQAMRNYLLGSNNIQLQVGPEIPPELPQGSLSPIPTRIIPTAPKQQTSDSGLSTLTIVGIVISVLIFLTIIAVLIMYFNKT